MIRDTKKVIDTTKKQKFKSSDVIFWSVIGTIDDITIDVYLKLSNEHWYVHLAVDRTGGLQ